MGLISPIGEIGKIGKMSVDKIAAMCFESKGGKDYIVEVYKRDTPGVMYNLTPAADPFSTAENTSDDPMEPVRGSTGYLRFMYEGGANGDGEPWWVDLMPADATEVAVYLKDAEGVIYWQGYAAPSQYSHDYSEEVQTIELPIVSALEVLNAIEMDAANVMQAATWRDLLVEAIDKSGLSVSGLWVPYEWGTEKLSSEYAVERVADINFAAPLLCKVSRFAWFDTTDAKNDGDPNYREYEGASYGTMLADWCRFFGWTLKERGSEWWLVSRRARKYCKLTAAQLENLTDEQLMGRDPRGAVDVQTVELTDALLDGINHSLDVAPAVRTVEVDADSQKIDADVLGIGDNDVKFAEVVKVEAQQIGRNSVLKNIYRKEIRYNFVGDKVVAYNEEFMDGARRYYKKAMWVKADWYERSEETADPPKINYSYADALLVSWYCADADMFETRTMLRMRSKMSYILTNGYLCINMSVKALSYIMTNKDLTLVLRVGGKWWSGSAWVDERTTFKPVFDYLDESELTTETHNTKTLAMNCNAEGYMIPIEEELIGELELELIATPMAYQPEQGPMVVYSDTWLISKFAVEYVPNESDESRNLESVNKYYAVTGATGTETKKIGLSLATENNNSAGHGLIKYDGAIADGTTFMTPPTAGREAEVSRPEEVLLATARAAYGVRRRKLQMVMTLANRERPIDYMTRAEWNNPFVPVAEAIDWAEDRRTLTLMG